MGAVNPAFEDGDSCNFLVFLHDLVKAQIEASTLLRRFKMKAFPTAADNGHSDNQDGMNLRDYFAAKALAAIIQRNTGHADSWPETAYRIADAMMKVREQ